MNGCRLSSRLIQQTTDFHGHWCPGLAIGIRAAEWALNEMGKSPDEEIVAVVETDMCGVDAVQFLVGCTFGKGNLIHRDYGKNAFSFYRRRDGKVSRLVARPGLHGEAGQMAARLNRKMHVEGLTREEETIREETRENISRWIMEQELETLFEMKIPTQPVPKKARIMSSLICEHCGESVMESRIRRWDTKFLCIPCFEDAEVRS